MAKDGKAAAVPRLRFPEFREAEDWSLEQGDNLFGAINNRSSSEALPILAITQEYGAVPRDQIDYHVSVTEQSIESYKIVEIGDFIISLRSFQGGIEYSNCRGICSPAYVILRRKGKGSDSYFRHLFKSARFIQQLTRNIEGLRDGKMISYKQFSEQQIPAPKPPEQQKIADCLTSLDELIATQGRKVDALKTYKCGLMQQLFPRESETLPRLRFPEFASTTSWHSQKVASLLNKASFPVNIEPEKMYREIGIRSHGKGIFHKEPVLGKVIGEKRVFQVVKGALALNIVFAWEQAVATTSEKEVEMIASHRFPMFVAKPGKCDVEYVKWFFLTKEGKRLLGVASPGGAGRNKTLGQKEFERLAIVLPVSVYEQMKIANCLSSFDARIATEIERLDVLKAHKMGLMQQLFPALEELDA